ncbi:MAG: peptidase M13 [Burkholderiales bacterium PBB3]|nr:MAG: peptidase M13 [Burkholderiales bacterium PBB3]
MLKIQRFHPRTLTLSLCMAALCATSALAQAPTSGIDKTQFDTTVRPQDDFHQYVSGTWLKNTAIPADKSSWGSFQALHELTQPQLRSIVEAAAKDGKKAGAEAQKIGDLYTSFMDEKTRDALGLKPLQAELARIAALKDKKQIPALIAHYNHIGVTAPYDLQIHQDAKDATVYVADLVQNGLGLPDRDYYLKDDDARLKDMRDKYLAHVERTLGMAGVKNAPSGARDVLALETALAKAQWSKVENRDPVKTYNRVEISKLADLAAGYDWPAYLNAAGVGTKLPFIVVSQPGYLTGFNAALQATPLETWKTYFTWHLLNTAAPYLSQDWVNARFAFYGTALSGVPQLRPAWQRAMSLEDKALGEALGKLYVQKHFPAESKVRMEKLVANMLLAFKNGIDNLDWMTPATKKEAQAKLATFVPKIGYPKKWRDYSKLQIRANDLVGNVFRANSFEHERNVGKLGKPIDRDEWFMAPQTVNAYYNPEMNEIVFPAVILQPPFFDPKAEDAVNYGAIGAVIGHEISHGFDDQGSQYDGLGNLRNWWTEEDNKRFAAKTGVLVKQYAAYSPVPGYFINGELTLGENIADTSGLAVAAKAYQLSLGGKPAPVLDGFTGEQRVYIGFAQIWRSKMREAQALVQVKSDPHSAAEFRIQGTLVNQPEFHRVFDVKPGDKMYVPPEQRVVIW